MVKRHVQPLKSLLHLFVVAVHNFPRGNAVLFRTEGDGRAVFIASADPNDIGTGHAFEPCSDVTGQVGTGNVSNVDLAIGVGQGRRHH